MRTEQHTSSGRVHVEITNQHGPVQIQAGSVAQADVQLTPVTPGDTIAAERIRNAEITSRGSQFIIHVPAPEGSTVITSVSGNSITAINNVVSGNMHVGAGDVYINGVKVSGDNTGNPGHSGKVQAVVRVPEGSDATVDAQHGSLTTTGALANVNTDTRHGKASLDSVTETISVDARHGEVRIARLSAVGSIDARHGSVNAHVGKTVPLTVDARRGRATVTAASEEARRMIRIDDRRGSSSVRVH